MWLAPRATFLSGLRWRSSLLQWNFLVGIGPNNQVRNVSFGTRPAVRHAAGDNDHVALDEPSRHSALNAVAPEVRPISESRWPRLRRLFQCSAGHQHSGALQHDI